MKDRTDWQLFAMRPSTDGETPKLSASFTSLVHTEPDGSASQSMTYRRFFDDTPDGRKAALAWIASLEASETLAGGPDGR